MISKGTRRRFVHMAFYPLGTVLSLRMSFPRPSAEVEHQEEKNVAIDHAAAWANDEFVEDIRTLAEVYRDAVHEAHGLIEERDITEHLTMFFMAAIGTMTEASSG